MATLKQKNGDVDKLLRQKAEKGSPAEQKQKDDIKKLAAALLDYDELAQKSLAAHWDKLTPAQRTEFVTTLRELIERNYVKQLRTNLDYQVQYKNEEVDGRAGHGLHGGEGQVAGQEHRRRDHLQDEEGRATAGACGTSSPTRSASCANYKTQFNKIITEQSYDALIKKMKSKLKDGE